MLGSNTLRVFLLPWVSLVMDPATYLLHEADAFVVIGTHVDDLFVVYNVKGKALRDKLWIFLNTKLTIKSMGEAK